MENKNLKNKQNEQTIGWRTDQLLPRVGGGRRVGTGVDIRGLFGGDWKGTVLCLICGCGYRTPCIYQNSKNYTPRRVFLLYAYKLIHLHFIEPEMHSTAGFT